VADPRGGERAGNPSLSAEPPLASVEKPLEAIGRPGD
jgi:hypothetical protein